MDASPGRRLGAWVFSTCMAACGGPAAQALDATLDASGSDAALDAPSASNLDAVPPEAAADAALEAAVSQDADAALEAAVSQDAGWTPGAPLVGMAGTWTWVDVPGMACSDGSPTGVALNLSTTGSTNVMVFLNGGGACWDGTTCFTLNTAVPGPWGAAQFAQIRTALGTGLFDRTNTANPFRDWNVVFVPYCTGDLHAGTREATFFVSGGSRTWRFVGHDNLRALAPRLLGTFATPGTVAIVGTSTGGLGAALNHDLFRSVWPSSATWLLDDSGPLLDGTAFSTAVRSAWDQAWAFDARVRQACGTACDTDLSALWSGIGTRFPADRVAFLSSTQDRTMATYFQLSVTDYEAALRRTAAARFDGASNRRYFVVSGQSHTMLGTPASWQSGGVSLWDWLGAMATGSAAWVSRGL